MERMEVQKESFTVTFDGASAARHEIDVQLLANALLAMKSAFEKMGTASYGRNADVYMKVRGQFRASSFGVDLLMGCAMIASTVTPVIPSFLSSFVDLIQITIWAKGKPIEKKVTPNDQRVAVKDSDNAVLVSNHDGQQTVINGNVYNYYTNSNIRREMGRIVEPISKGGADKMIISTEPDAQGTLVSVGKAEAVFFDVNQDDDSRESSVELQVEIRTANFDGKPGNWRFFDGDLEFSAQITDQDFLDKVRTREIPLSSGDQLVVTLVTTQKKQSLKLKTDRLITEVKEHIPFESSALPAGLPVLGT